MEKLSKEIESETIQVQEEYAKGGKTATKEQISDEVATRLQAKGVSTSKLHVDHIGVSEVTFDLEKNFFFFSQPTQITKKFFFSHPKNRIRTTSSKKFPNAPLLLNTQTS
jgi:hypothetical protein